MPVLNVRRSNDFLQKHEGTFFIACEDAKCRLYANGTIGIPKGHKFMKEVVSALHTTRRENNSNEPDWKLTGPTFFTK